MDSFNTLALLVFGVAAALLLGRAISLWYFRINEAVELLKEMRDQLRKANGETIAAPEQEPV
jgi:hypothetical protein